MDYREGIRRLDSFSEAFELARMAVDERLKMRRVGLNLLLQDMPSFVGAYHIIGSNFIVINRTVLAAIKSLAKSKEEYNSYLFVVIMHEYLHSLGITDENMVRVLAYEICLSLLGEEHTATKMARNDPSSLYPELRNILRIDFGTEFELVKDFDRSNLTYIG